MCCRVFIFFLSVLPALISVQDIQIYDEDASLEFPRDLIGPYEVRNSTLVRVNPQRNLMLNGSGIADIHRSVFNSCGETVTLSMAHNSLTTLTEEMFKGLRNLEAMNFLKNNIEGIGNGTFHGSPRLRVLELSFNRLNGLGADVRNGLGELRALTLNENPIILSDDGFVGMSKLEILELSRTNISTLSTGSFNGLGHIKRLDLSGNELTSLTEPSFQGLMRLEELVLSLNLISTISKNAFKGLTNLKYLWLNNNRIGSLRDLGVFQWIPNLDVLYLQKNLVEFLDFAVFKDMQSVSIEPGFVTGYTESVRKIFANATSATYHCRQPFSEAEIRSGYAETVRRDYVAVTLAPFDYKEIEGYGYFVPLFCNLMLTTNNFNNPNATGRLRSTN